MGSFMSFLRDLISDVKSSRRFQVGLVLWIPLIVVSAILVVRFGIRHTLSEKYREFKTTFIRESQVAYPNLEMYFLNPPQTKTCAQRVNHVLQAPITIGSCSDAVNGRIPLTCLYFPFSKDIAIPPQNGDPWGNPIVCNFTFNQNGNQNLNGDNEMFLLTPGGWNTSSTWNYQNPYFLRPNHFIGVSLFHELFFGFGQRVDNWFAQITYQDSNFPSNRGPYWTAIEFRIPFTSVEVNWEDDGFDSWFLMAAWGGGIFFFYLLHVAAFGIAKFFLPEDSRLLRAGGADASATPLIS